MEKRVKVRRKLSFKKIFIVLMTVVLSANFVMMLLDIPIKNIYILGTINVSDDEIIKLAEIEDYPSFILTSKEEIKEKILTNPYIKSVSIEKKLGAKLYIKVLENNPLCVEKNTKQIILDNGSKVDNIYNLKGLPILINDVNSVFETFTEKFALIDKNILKEISQIEYSPVAVDSERFYLAMTDGNYVYVTLTKITAINRYYDIKEKLGSNKGIVYLDSGNYIEIKETVDSSQTGENGEDIGGENSSNLEVEIDNTGSSNLET